MRSLNTNLMIKSTKTGRGKHFFSQYFVLYIVLIFCIYQYGIHRIYGFSIYPDEFGYWASAARWNGFDWSGVVSLGYYYSFGYSLILAPILRLCQDSVMAYRAAVTSNVLLQCISIGLLYGIFKRMYSSVCSHSEETCKKEMQVIFAVGAAVFYPVWTFYTQMTLSEALLTFLYVFICWQAAAFFEKPRIISGMLLSIAFIYLYFVHMRTVGVVIAAVLTIFVYTWQTPAYRKIVLAGIAVLLVGAGIGLWLKSRISGTVYIAMEAEHMAVNDYASQLGKLKTILTIEGMRQLVRSCAGKLYYLGMASFGLIYPAVGLCLKKTMELLTAVLKKTEEKNETETKIFRQNWFYLFLLLSMTGQFLISAIYMSNPGRLDGIVYGRYNDYLLPVFIGIGILALFESRYLLRNFLISVGISTLLFCITLWTALYSDLTAMQGYFAAGISYLSNDKDYRILPEFVKAYLFGVLLMAIVTGCIYLCRRLKKNTVATGIILLMEILLTLCLNEKYTYFFNDVDYYDLRICEYMEVYGEEAPISYLHGESLPFIDLLQFAMRDKEITIIMEQDISASDGCITQEILKCALLEEGFLITGKESKCLVELEELYEKCMESDDFVLFRLDGMGGIERTVEDETDNPDSLL